MDTNKGIVLAYLTALVSGISVFANSFGVLTLDSTVYTFVKNVLVAAILASLALAAGNWRELLTLKRKQALMLAFVGMVGGGIAFALFFAGLAQVSGALGSFLYRFLFLFAAIIGVFALREKMTLKVAAGALLILASNFLLLGTQQISLTSGALLVLAATFLWACEYAVSKKALESLSSTTVAAARMGIGSLVLLSIILWQGKVGTLLQITPASFLWIAVATALLTLFTTLWYSALKHATLTAATAVLALGGSISSLLSFALAGKALTAVQAGAFVLLAIGVVFVVGAAQTASAFAWARERTASFKLKL